MANADSPSRGVSRRAFSGRLLALTGGAALAAHAVPCAGAVPLAPASGPGVAHAGTVADPISSPSATVAEKVRRVEARWGSRLDAAQRRRLRGIIGYHETMLGRLRAVTLANADAPATVLKDRS